MRKKRRIIHSLRMRLFGTESGFEGILPRGAFAGFGFGSGGLLGVEAVGLDLLWGGH